MPLYTVTDYLGEARVLLQDARAPFRYSDVELTLGLGNAIYEARRLRPDLFPLGVVQELSSTAPGNTTIAMNLQYRMALVFYMVSYVMLREEEESQQQVARAYRQAFGAQLVSVAV